MAEACSRLELFSQCRAVFDQQPVGFEQIDYALFGNRSFFSSATLRAVPESGLRPLDLQALQQNQSDNSNQEKIVRTTANTFYSCLIIGRLFQERTIFVFNVEGEDNLTT